MNNVATGMPETSPTARRQVGAIVLAAGASVRMGRPKQLLPLNNTTLVVHVVTAFLGAPVWPVVVVLGAHADEIRPQLAALPVLVIENETWPEGMASSIRCGITTLQQFSRNLAGAVVALCDQPALSSPMIARLTDEHVRTGKSIVAAHYAGRCGAPVLFSRRHFAELQALTGEQGARAVVDAHAPDVAAVELPELAFDLDTPEQFEAWRRSSR